MNFDERIKQTLEQNSNWSGSSELLWKKVASQLGTEKPIRKRQPFWLTAAVAAMLLLALTLHNVLSPLPPDTAEQPEMARMQTFSAVMMPQEPQVVRVGENVELPVDISLAREDHSDAELRLLIWHLDDAGETLVDELAVDGSQLLEQASLKMQAPSELGSYRLALQGTIRADDQLYAVWAEQMIVVEK